MAGLDDFKGRWKVVAVQSPAGETVGHVLVIDGKEGPGGVTIECLGTTPHPRRTGTYAPPPEEAIAGEDFKITMAATSPKKVIACSAKLPTGTWTAEDSGGWGDAT